MRTQSDLIRGDLRVASDLAFLGEVIGDVVVEAGAKLVLHGIIVGDLTLESGSAVDLWGLVRGDVHDRGGRVNLYGKVMGQVFKGGTATANAAPCVRNDPAASARWQRVTTGGCPNCDALPPFHANFCPQCGCDLRRTALQRSA